VVISERSSRNRNAKGARALFKGPVDLPT